MANTEQVIRLLKRKKAANMEALRDALGGCSRRSVFRYLERVGYLSSFTHAGRYYTLESTAQFDTLDTVGEIFPFFLGQIEIGAKVEQDALPWSPFGSVGFD